METMEEEDEIDVLGEFNLESLLTKNDDQISSCYDSDHQLGLHCESQWMLETNSQASWYDTKSDPQQSSFGGFSNFDLYDSNKWTDKERYLLEKGLELFGRSWSRLAQYIGTKTANQVKLYVKAMGTGFISKSSGSTSSFGVDNADFNFSELINDMDIPASMEEVIAVVSTAQPTVVLPSSKKDNPTLTNTSSSRKLKNRVRKKNAFATKRRLVNEKPKEIIHIYNAEDIKEVLTDNKESDHIVLPNGEQVIRIRHGTSLSEDSDIDVDVDSDLEKDKDELTLEQKECHEEEVQQERGVDTKVGEPFHCKNVTSHHKSQNQTEESKVCSVDVRRDRVSLLSESVGQQQKKETQLFKGSLMTPSGKIMTVVVDDVPCRSDHKDHYNCNNKACTKTSHMVNGKGEVIEEINHNECPMSTAPADKRNSCTSLNIFEDEKSKITQDPSGKFPQVEDISKTKWRLRKKKLAVQDHAGGYTMVHTDSGEVVRIQNSLDKVKTKRIKPVKLIQCKNHSVGNKTPYKVELDVSALVLVDVHSHLSPKCEVIGLLGGQYRPQDGGVLSITIAVPCRTILSSNIHCDMCPVSQLESSNIIADRGLSIVGWYHSHPEFDPSPSDTDIETQNSLQSWFNSTGNPFVGLIISPYTSSHHTSIYRCCHVINEKGNLIPYKLEVTLTNDFYDIGLLKLSIEAAHKTLQNGGSFMPKDDYFRCVDSVKHHLRKARVEEYKIVQVVVEICNFFAGKPLKPSLVT